MLEFAEDKNYATKLRGESSNMSFPLSSFMHLYIKPTDLLFIGVIATLYFRTLPFGLSDLFSSNLTPVSHHLEVLLEKQDTSMESLK